MTEQAANHQTMEATFSTLILSIASSAAISLGLAPNPQTGKTEKDLNLARFNIDLLGVLEEKTKNNLTKEEADFFESILSDLRLRFVQSK